MSDPITPPVSRPPHFTKASWLAVFGGLLLTTIAYKIAMAHRQPGEWFPGLGEAIIGILATAAVSFACGLTALLRHERYRWAALPPFLAGLGTLLYAGWCYLRH